MKIVLASSSSGRQMLMKEAGFDFIVDPADIDERKYNYKSAKKLVKILAQKKAEVVAKRHENAIVIGSDLMVSFQDKQIGKPDNAEDAKRILKILRGETHQVLTATTVINTKTGEINTIEESANIKMRQYSDREIEQYVSTGEPLDKGGAYAIQGRGRSLVESINGDEATIIGLPMQELKKYLE